MSKACENRYKLCRENAGFTQEHAAGLLHISARTLSDYENGHSKVPDDVVDAMAEHYKCTALPFWHLKHHSILGKYLPEVFMPSTVGDMAFQAILAQDDLAPTVEVVKQLAKQLMVTGEWCEQKKHDLRNTVETWTQVKSKLLSAIVYAKRIIDS
ncbi:MAG: helix-turn-helix transcriptional regulator [Defluviitaleaceae bacterium]|nr:helix-turn-helix transcriptional regulator [Defluviitaleaceae bacterium]MCL2261636.1 helix-turn-helix transcriptional regulator [Defluviitaleaceae bacterium]